MCVLQHPAFKGLAPRVDPGVRVPGAFAASKEESDTSEAPKQLLAGHGATYCQHS